MKIMFTVFATFEFEKYSLRERTKTLGTTETVIIKSKISFSVVNFNGNEKNYCFTLEMKRALNFT